MDSASADTPPNSTSKKKNRPLPSRLATAIAGPSPPDSASETSHTSPIAHLNPSQEAVLRRIEALHTALPREREQLLEPIPISREDWASLKRHLPALCSSELRTFAQDKLRYGYSGLRELFEPRMPTPVHEHATRAFGEQVYGQLCQLRKRYPGSNLDKLCASGASTVKLGKRKRSEGGSTRDPDESWTYLSDNPDELGRRRHVALLEVSFSEKEVDLEASVSDYFLQPSTSPRALFIIDVQYKRPDDSSPRPVCFTDFRLHRESHTHCLKVDSRDFRIDDDSNSKGLFLAITDFLPARDLPPGLAADHKITIDIKELVARIWYGEQEYERGLLDSTDEEGEVATTPPPRPIIELPPRWLNRKKEREAVAE